MNDDELPTNAELASAYLDDELDAVERAAAAKDAHTMALVDSFARIRVELGNVGPVADSTRTAAMAAALFEFDAIHTAAAAAALPASATITSLDAHRRMRVYRLVTGAAAAAIVVVVGVAALNASRDDSKSSSAPAAATAELPAPKALDTAAAAGSAEVFAATAADGAPPIINTADELTAYAASVAVVRNAAPPAAGQAPTADASDVSALPACLAPTDTVLGAIIVHDTQAFAVRDADGELRALDASDCTVLIPDAP
jgi:negative regulator of sigma E activity